jgi:membrane-bound serine protease (ClpP class)
VLQDRGLIGPAGDNGWVIILVGVLVAIFVVPDAWTVPVVVGAVALEVTETVIGVRLSRRGAPKVDVDHVIGQVGVVVQACHPRGSVRVGGEPWTARCEAGADVGDRVQVRAREGLTLVVEPVDTTRA